MTFSVWHVNRISKARPFTARATISNLIKIYSISDMIWLDCIFRRNLINMLIRNRISLKEYFSLWHVILLLATARLLVFENNTTFFSSNILHHSQIDYINVRRKKYRIRYWNKLVSKKSVGFGIGKSSDSVSFRFWVSSHNVVWNIFISSATFWNSLQYFLIVCNIVK